MSAMLGSSENVDNPGPDVAMQEQVDSSCSRPNSASNLPEQTTRPSRRCELDEMFWSNKLAAIDPTNITYNYKFSPTEGRETGREIGQEAGRETGHERQTATLLPQQDALKADAFLPWRLLAGFYQSQRQS
jgi:hypothetical protein